MESQADDLRGEVFFSRKVTVDFYMYMLDFYYYVYWFLYLK